MVVSRSDLVALCVGELQFNMRLIEFTLIENGRCQPTESAPSHPITIAKPVEGVENCVVADGLFLVASASEHKVAVACDLLERTQDFHGLAGQWNDMRSLHLHALRWNRPARLIQIEL